MRYMARRVISGEWLTRDLALRDVELTTTLSGPTTITGTIDPELNRYLWDDKLRIAEDWATRIYVCEEDTGAIYTSGIVLPPTTYEDTARITCAGASAYPNGYIYTDTKLWGPQARVKAKKNKRGKIIRKAKPEIPRPDPIEIFVDHWDWIQSQDSSDLDITIVGDKTTRNAEGVVQVPIGNYAEPYRLRKWEAPDLGSEIENLAQITPFEWVEETDWANEERTEANHKLRVGWPRMGRDRSDDLRFVQGENVVLVPQVQTIEGGANHLVGLGKGEAGPSMVYDDMAWTDGRLRRTRVLTDKTATAEVLKRRMLIYQEALKQRYDVTQVAIIDHRNARISDLQLGDDIRVQAEHPEYGALDIKVRILSITRGDSDEAAVLTTSASVFFIYKPSEELS